MINCFCGLVCWSVYFVTMWWYNLWLSQYGLIRFVVPKKWMIKRGFTLNLNSRTFTLQTFQHLEPAWVPHVQCCPVSCTYLVSHNCVHWDLACNTKLPNRPKLSAWWRYQILGWVGVCMNLTTTTFMGVLSFQFVGCHLNAFRSMVIKFSQKSDVWAFMSKVLQMLLAASFQHYFIHFRWAHVINYFKII